MAGITWLHVSDWHQNLEDDFSREYVFTRLLADIRQRESISTQLREINFIVFTGDITNRAERREYGAVWEQFFQPVIDAAGIVPNPQDNKSMFLYPAITT